MMEESQDVPVPSSEPSQEAAPQPQSDAASDAGADERQEVSEQAESKQESNADLPATVEAVLFSSDKPLSPPRIADVCESSVKAVRQAIAALNERYEHVGCSFRVVEIGGGFQLQTLPQYADVLAHLVSSRNDSKLSQAALETLAVVAYRQPVLRADIEAIRGVACGEVLRTLMERNLVRIVGRAEEIGRPMLYGTTKYFLEVFGLANLEDLPNAEQLRRPPDKPQAAAPAAATAGGPSAETAGEPATPDQPVVENASERKPVEAAPLNAAEPAGQAQADQPPGEYVSDRPSEPVP